MKPADRLTRDSLYVRSHPRYLGHSGTALAVSIDWMEPGGIRAMALGLPVLAWATAAQALREIDRITSVGPTSPMSFTDEELS